MNPHKKSKMIAFGQLFVLLVLAGCLCGLALVAACDAVVRKFAVSR